MQAGTVIYETPCVAHTQYIGCSQEGRESGALDFLLAQLVEQVYHDKPFFNFGISNENDGHFLNQGLIEFKEGFGGDACGERRLRFQSPGSQPRCPAGRSSPMTMPRTRLEDCRILDLPKIADDRGNLSFEGRRHLPLPCGACIGFTTYPAANRAASMPTGIRRNSSRALRQFRGVPRRRPGPARLSP